MGNGLIGSIADNKKVCNIISGFCMVLLVLGLGGCIYLLLSSQVLINKYYAGCSFIEVIIAIVYASSQFKKDTSYALRFLFIFAAITSIVDVAFYYLDIETFIAGCSPIVVILSMVTYGNFILLGFGKDLGKTASITMCCINCFIYLYNMIDTISLAGSDIETIILNVLWFVLSLIALLFIICKYIDKYNRNTK